MWRSLNRHLRSFLQMERKWLRVKGISQVGSVSQELRLALVGRKHAPRVHQSHQGRNHQRLTIPKIAYPNCSNQSKITQQPNSNLKNNQNRQNLMELDQMVNLGIKINFWTGQPSRIRMFLTKSLPCWEGPRRDRVKSYRIILYIPVHTSIHWTLSRHWIHVGVKRILRVERKLRLVLLAQRRKAGRRNIWTQNLTSQKHPGIIQSNVVRLIQRI